MLFILYVIQREMQPAEQQHTPLGFHDKKRRPPPPPPPPWHVHPVLGHSKQRNLKRAIACSLDVYVQAATNGTPCGYSRLGSLHVRTGVPSSMSPKFCGASRRCHVKSAIACSLDVYVQAATNGTPCSCARLGSLHDRRGFPFCS